MSNEKPRVMVLGLDGATFDIIEPLVAEGRLPNLGRLMAQGSYGVLRSTYPPITPSAWTSFATGKNPGNHGLFDFQRVEANTYRFVPVPSNQHGQRTLWGILRDEGRRSVVLDVPFTYPPEPIQGCMITGYGTPTTEGTVFVYPPQLREELITHCGGCEVATAGTKYNLTADYFERWDHILASRARIAPYLMEREDWDFFMIVYGVTDNVQHNLWAFLEPQHPAYYSDEGRAYRQRLFDYYEKVDALIGNLLVYRDASTHVLVMSDHGFGSTRTGKYLSKLLMDEGLIHYKGLPLVSGPTTWLMQRLLNLYHRTPLLGNIVRRLSGKQKLGLKQALTRTALLPTSENIDWERTLAFPGGYGLQVYINRRDRFPRGIVSPGAEYEELIEHITERLLALTDPVSGDAVIKAVHRACDIYHGPFADRAPDLIVEYANAYKPGCTQAPNVLNPGLEGNHTMEGVFIGHGPHILPQGCSVLTSSRHETLTATVSGATHATKHRLGSNFLPQAAPGDGGYEPRRTRTEQPCILPDVPVEAQIVDLAPTALYLLGLPIPEDMDGRVLTEIIAPDHLAARPVTYGPATAASVSEEGYSPEEVESVREQLRALGYLE